MNAITLSVSGIRCFGRHGCLDEEAKIGSEYTVDVEFAANITKACTDDTLKDTIDYVTVHRIIIGEMAVRSKLIEHVAWRMVKALMTEFPGTTEIRVHLTKHRPPINNGYLGNAKVTVSSLDFSSTK